MTECVLRRIWKRVYIDPESGCWNFTGATVTGYGRIGYADTHRLCHRIMYEALVGPVPEGLDLDHLCRNRSCCNPMHLEPVTRLENLLRGDTLIAANARAHDCELPGCKSCQRFRASA